MATIDNEPTLTDTDGGALRHLLQTLGVGVALVSLNDWGILFENASFFKWFPPASDADEPLTERLVGMNAARVEQRLAGGRPFSYETETQAGGRTIPIAVDIRPMPAGPDGEPKACIVECRDVSKQKQAEYMLDSYSTMAEKNARELQREKERVERLLLNVMPRSVYEEMRNYGTVTPQLFENASILMLDFVGSTEMAISRDPGSLVTELNDIFNVFDRITEMFSSERIRTVGDAYMAVCGIPEVNPEHAHNIAKVALRMLRYIQRRNSAHPEAWECRIGINTGPVVGSLVGVQKYVYDIFGPGVNLAARMESLSEPMQITISEETYHLLKNDFVCSERGDFEVKGFGTQRLYFLERELAQLR
jgi:adenylate cyclase